MKNNKKVTPTNGCGGNKNTKCEIPYVLPFTGTKEEFQKHVKKSTEYLNP